MHKNTRYTTKIIDEYNLNDYNYNRWTYIEVRKTTYELTLSEKLANYLLTKWLNKSGFHTTPTTPIL